MPKKVDVEPEITGEFRGEPLDHVDHDTGEWRADFDPISPELVSFSRDMQVALVQRVYSEEEK